MQKPPRLLARSVDEIVACPTTSREYRGFVPIPRCASLAPVPLTPSVNLASSILTTALLVLITWSAAAVYMLHPDPPMMHKFCWLLLPIFPMRCIMVVPVLLDVGRTPTLKSIDTFDPFTPTRVLELNMLPNDSRVLLEPSPTFMTLNTEFDSPTMYPRLISLLS